MNGFESRVAANAGMPQARLDDLRALFVKCFGSDPETTNVGYYPGRINDALVLAQSVRECLNEIDRLRSRGVK